MKTRVVAQAIRIECKLKEHRCLINERNMMNKAMRRPTENEKTKQVLDQSL